VRSGGATPGRWLPAAGIGVVLAAGVALATFTVVRSAATERERHLATAADNVAARLVAVVERNIVEMERLAALADDVATFRRLAQARISRLRELTTAALARVEDGDVVVDTAVPTDAGPLSTGTDLGADPAFAAILGRVLTEADATAGAPHEANRREVISVAAPILEVVDGSESALRRSVRGVVVGALDVQRLFDGRWAGPINLTAPNGESVGGDAQGDVLDEVLKIGGRSWTLRLDAPRAPWPVGATVVAVLGVPLAVGIFALFHHQLSRRRAAEAQAENRSQQLERIADAGARLQQSLDLAELLPAFAVALADDFQLRSVAIGLFDADGDLIETFATGDRFVGAELELPLRRGWRAVGMLGVRSDRTLDAVERTSLQALADLLAVAMSNSQLYEREQQNAARLRDLDALKNAFLGTVSHELRTSMTAIMGFGELLSDAWDNLDDARRREMATRIRRSAGSLRHLVDDLLDFARLEQERLRVSPRSIDLAGVVRTTVDGLSPLLTHHELEMHVLDSLTAWADPVAVERILANLLSNAAKYAPHDTTVTVTVSSAGDRARLEVADQGPGIPPEERRRIFARFYRLNTPEAVRTRGAGIGLAILHDFAERSGATVVVDDAPGGGARFVVDFPTTAPSVDQLEVAQ
jgi:signal transduction histidine kinase